MQKSDFNILRVALALALASALGGCPPASNSDSVTRGLAYLDSSQTKADHPRQSPVDNVDYIGNWPQVFHFKKLPELHFNDVSPFVVAFIHHSLTLITDANAAQLGISQDAVDAATTMRQRAITNLQKFASRIGDPDEGTFGFWPYPDPTAPNSPIMQALLLQIMGGPILGGTRVPINLSWFAPQMAIPADADVTAATYLALLNDGLIANDAPTGANVAHFFTDWRDTGAAPLRLTPDWLPHNSGAYLTWLAYRPVGEPLGPNDVDLIVVANVLHALARFNQSSAAGFAESVSLINSVVDQGLENTAYPSLTSYYPDSYVLHYCVSRACFEGPIPSLQNATDKLADDVEDNAVVVDGKAYWNKGDIELNTASAVLTLIQAGRKTPLIEQGVAYLESTQNALSGDWKKSVFFIAKGDTGTEVDWESSALTTAIALEAICRYRLSL